MSQTNENVSELIIHLEKSALDRWYRGDPGLFLDLSAEDVVYFDPFLEKRIDNHEQLTAYYMPSKSEVTEIPRYELIDPKVQWVENMAVLTFNLRAYSKEMTYRWNCTEVYRKEEDGNWKIIQTHWSFTRPDLK